MQIFSEAWSLDSLLRIRSTLQLWIIPALSVAIIIAGLISWMANERITEIRARRSVGAAQRAALRNALMETVPVPLRIAVVPRDLEARSFAAQLADALRAADWPPVEIRDAEPSNEFHTGLFLAVGPGPPGQPGAMVEAHALHDALVRAGIAAVKAERADLPPRTLELLVGHKP